MDEQKKYKEVQKGTREKNWEFKRRKWHYKGTPAKDYYKSSESGIDYGVVYVNIKK